jgi:hypothetical protein
MKDEMKAMLALTRSFPFTRPVGPPVYVASSQLAPFASGA